MEGPEITFDVSAGLLEFVCNVTIAEEKEKMDFSKGSSVLESF